jgi:adenosylcobinamide kinase/adenosylcobinamide-phosphate guanylyltransferase
MAAGLIVVGGGVRSGKSRFALERARALGPRRVLVATAEVLDDEMRERIAHHRRERGAEFRTIEAPRGVVAATADITDADVVVVDCLTMWLSNLLLANASASHVESEVERWLAVVEAAPFATVAVTNEVGMGVVPESALGRLFRDVQGRCNQQLSGRASELYFAALGTVLRLRPAPIEIAL